MLSTRSRLEFLSGGYAVHRIADTTDSGRPPTSTRSSPPAGCSKQTDGGSTPTRKKRRPTGVSGSRNSLVSTSRPAPSAAASACGASRCRRRVAPQHSARGSHHDLPDKPAPITDLTEPRRGDGKGQVRSTAGESPSAAGCPTKPTPASVRGRPRQRARRRTFELRHRAGHPVRGPEASYNEPKSSWGSRGLVQPRIGGMRARPTHRAQHTGPGRARLRRSLLVLVLS